jgi:ankyrin repeat protein
MTDGRLLPMLFLALTLSGCGQPPAASNTTTPPPTAGVPGDPNPPIAPPTSKESELIAAAVKGDNAQIARLLADGVNVNARDNEGGTALAHAAWFGHLETVRLLLEKGADVNAKKKDGSTPVLLATWNKHPDVVEVLAKAGAK